MKKNPQTPTPYDLYEKLQEELRQNEPDLNTVVFLTGAVHALRLEMYDFKVPEIENAFIFIEKHLGRGFTKCLLTR